MRVFENKGFIFAATCLTAYALVTWAAPRYVMHKYGDRYAQLYLGCEEAKFSAQSLKRLKKSITPKTAMNLQKTLNIEMITCFEMVALASEMRERGVKEASLDILEIRALSSGARHVVQLTRRVEKQQSSRTSQ